MVLYGKRWGFPDGHYYSRQVLSRGSPRKKRTQSSVAMKDDLDEMSVTNWSLRRIRNRDVYDCVYDVRRETRAGHVGLSKEVRWGAM
jgi:hypothetical protein